MAEVIGQETLGVKKKFVRELPAFGRYGNGPLRGNAVFMGEPDGPMRFVKSLGMEVPTYIDPRNDLKSQYKSASAHVSIDYHVPISMRGPYVPRQLGDYDETVDYQLTASGKVRCGGLRNGGQICQKSAVNRTGFCTNHGGALHPADKLFSSERGIMPSDASQLNRLQKVEMGIIPVTELSDLEISRQQVMQEDGTFSKTTQALSSKIIGQMRTEFFNRAEQFVRENTLDMLEEMKKIALSQVAEDKDKIQAIQWMTERVLGKTPDVLITNKTDSPFENLMGDIEGGSREAYRRQANLEPLHGGVPVIDGEILHELDELNGENDDESADGEYEGSQADSDRNGQAVERADGGEDQSSGGESAPDICDGKEQESEPDSPMAIAAARKARKDQIRKARARKYAAKSRGMDTLDNLPYEIRFIDIELKSGPATRMKLIAPEDQKAPRMR